MTFKELQDDVWELCQELAGITGFNVDKVKHYINRGYRNFVKDTYSYEVVLSITTVANQQFYTSSDDAGIAYLYKIIGCRYIEDASSEIGKSLAPYPGGYDNLPKSKSYSGSPDYYYTQGFYSKDLRKIGLWPIADTSGDIFEIRAYSYPTTDLSNNSDEPKIQDEWTDGIVFYAVWRLFHIYGHAKPQWRQKALEHKALYQEIVNAYNMQTTTEKEETEYVLDAYEDFD